MRTGCPAATAAVTNPIIPTLASGTAERLLIAPSFRYIFIEKTLEFRIAGSLPAVSSACSFSNFGGGQSASAANPRPAPPPTRRSPDVSRAEASVVSDRREREAAAEEAVPEREVIAISKREAVPGEALPEREVITISKAEAVPGEAVVTASERGVGLRMDRAAGDAGAPRSTYPAPCWSC